MIQVLGTFCLHFPYNVNKYTENPNRNKNTLQQTLSCFSNGIYNIPKGIEAFSYDKRRVGRDCQQEFNTVSGRKPFDTGGSCRVSRDKHILLRKS